MMIIDPNENVIYKFPGVKQTDRVKRKKGFE